MEGVCSREAGWSSIFAFYSPNEEFCYAELRLSIPIGKPLWKRFFVTFFNPGQLFSGSLRTRVLRPRNCVDLL